MLNNKKTGAYYLFLKFNFRLVVLLSSSSPVSFDPDFCSLFPYATLVKIYSSQSELVSKVDHL